MVYLIIGTILALGGLVLILTGFRTLGVALFVAGFFLGSKGRKKDSSDESGSDECGSDECGK